MFGMPCTECTRPIMCSGVDALMYAMMLELKEGSTIPASTISRHTAHSIE